MIIYIYTEVKLKFKAISLIFSVSDVMEMIHAEKFMKRFPTAAETGSVLVGVVDFIKNPVAAFVRLSRARDLGIQVNERLRCFQIQ